MPYTTTFDERLSRIQARHRRMSVGVSYRIGADGLMVPVPIRRVGPRIPMMAILLLLVLAYAFKAALFVGLGEGIYVTRLDLLAEAGAAGEAARWVMQPEPVVRTIAHLAQRAGHMDLPLP